MVNQLDMCVSLIIVSSIPTEGSLSICGLAQQINYISHLLLCASIRLFWVVMVVVHSVIGLGGGYGYFGQPRHQDPKLDVTSKSLLKGKDKPIQF